MTLYWPDTPAQIDLTGPRLHALIIGVGEYPHLIPGAPNTFGTNFGLQQLTTTVTTAKAIAEWLIANSAKLSVPLGSIEMLLSPAEQVLRSDGVQVAIEPATLANVSAAFKTRWLRERCKKQPGGISLFYFAGHGLSAAGAQYLLPADFADPAGTRWERCIDFTESRTGMGNVDATQLFFVDACRETPIDMLTQANPPKGVRLFDEATMFDRAASEATYYAAAEGRQAYGPDNDITYFCRALLESLEGAAALNKKGLLTVDTFSLANALGQIVASIAGALTKPLTCSPQPAGLPAVILRPGAAHVRTQIGCRTHAANTEAAITLQRGATLIQSPAGADRPWFGRLEPGDWTIELSFVQFPQHIRTETLMPPLFELEVAI